jgi:hypothetical protein
MMILWEHTETDERDGCWTIDMKAEALQEEDDDHNGVWSISHYEFIFESVH